MEVKSQSVTDPGRRGNRARLERVARDVLERSSDQTTRAAAYIVAGGRSFAPTEGADPVQLLDDDVAIPAQVVVSFEGIDPLCHLDGVVARDRGPLRVWVTDLADFLVVRDFLAEPRAIPGLRPRAQIRVALWRTWSRMRWSRTSKNGYDPSRHCSRAMMEVPVLPYRSGLINDYYTKVELGFPAERLGLGMPEEIRQALWVTGRRDNTFCGGRWPRQYSR